MSGNNITVVLAHGAWADGSSWSKVISPLSAVGVKSVAAPLPNQLVPGRERDQRLEGGAHHNRGPVGCEPVDGFVQRQERHWPPDGSG